MLGLGMALRGGVPIVLDLYPPGSIVIGAMKRSWSASQRRSATPLLSTPGTHRTTHVPYLLPPYSLVICIDDRHSRDRFTSSRMPGPRLWR
jgi:hypothetical protein